MKLYAYLINIYLSYFYRYFAYCYEQY